MAYRNLRAHRCKRPREEEGAEVRAPAEPEKASDALCIVEDVGGAKGATESPEMAVALVPHGTLAVESVAVASSEVVRREQLVRVERAAVEAPLNQEVLAGARLTGIIEDVIGSPTAPRLSPRLLAAMGGDLLRAPPGEIQAARDATAGWTPADRALMAAFAQGDVGSAPAVLQVVYRLLVPLGVAVIAAEAAMENASINQAALEVVARDPTTFARMRELSSASRAVVTTRVTATRESVTTRNGNMAGPPRLAGPHPRPSTYVRGIVCYSCKQEGHRAKDCPRRY